MNIQNVSTVPKYLDNFLQANNKALDEIYEESVKVMGDGILSLKCKQSENKIDVAFMNEELILNNFPVETWENLKSNRQNKKLYIIEDLEKSSMFIVYI